MRKGYKKIEVYFPDAEYEAFLKKVRRTNLSISEFVRRMAAEQVIREAPHVDVPLLIREVKRVGNNINQLLILANSKGFFDNLRWKDVDLSKGILRVNGAAVFDENGQLVRKQETKNKTSRRAVPIIPLLMDALQAAEQKGEYVVTWHPNAIMCRVNRVCSANGLPEVGLHGLRHSFASLSYHLNIPEKVVMEIGGWADNQTMRKIYTHISQKDVSDHATALTGFFLPKE